MKVDFTHGEDHLFVEVGLNVGEKLLAVAVVKVAWLWTSLLIYNVYFLIPEEFEYFFLTRTVLLTFT